MNSMALEGINSSAQGQNIQQVINNININPQLRSSHNVSHGKRRLVNPEVNNSMAFNKTQMQTFGGVHTSGAVNQSMNANPHLFSGTISYNDQDNLGSSLVFSPKQQSYGKPPTKKSV